MSQEIKAGSGALAVFGGSGASGMVLIQEALEQGFTVRALARNPVVIGIESDNLKVVFGSLLSRKDVEAVLAGCGAVLCVFGPRPPYADIFCEEATRIIVESMKARGVRRLICLTGGMIGDYPGNRTFPFRVMTALFKRRLPGVAADRVGQESLIMRSGLDWTIVKPPRLTNDSPKNKWAAGPGIRLGILSSVSRADLAGFLLAETGSARWVGQTVFIKS